MLSKSALVALGALAAFGVMASEANARTGFSHGGFKSQTSHVKIYRPGGSTTITHRPGPGIRPIYPGRPHWHVHHRYYRYAVPVAVGATYAVARPAVAGPCTCLSKEYTPEGVVVFKDLCTNEMAMNPPPAPPQQVGLVQSQ